MNCHNCGESLDLTTWTPTAVDTSGDTLTIHRFCERECREAWRE